MQAEVHREFRTEYQFFCQSMQPSDDWPGLGYTLPVDFRRRQPSLPLPLFCPAILFHLLLYTEKLIEKHNTTHVEGSDLVDNSKSYVRR